MAMFLFFAVILLALGLHLFSGLPHPLEMGFSLQFIGYFLMWAGLAIGLKRERTGGLVIIAGFILFWLVTATIINRIWLTGFLAMFPLTGVFYLLSWWFGRPRSGR